MVTQLIARLISRNAERWDSMHLRANRIHAFDMVAKRLCAQAAKDRYHAVEAATGVPWFVVAVIHEREATQSWNAQLGQGDPLNRISRHDPKGRGPFLAHDGDAPGNDAWHRAALDALIDCAPYAAKWTDWSAGGALTILEEYNGLGYALKGVPSAYVWSGSDQYTSGKYVADHVYRKGVIDVQEGCAPLISRMMAIDESVRFAEEAS
jgi:lysozyme family protein